MLCNGLDISKCYGQAYDGASNMSGHLNGVAARIQKEHPKAHYIHCVAHSLNLCLQDCGQNCVTIWEALTVTTELASIIRASPKRLAQFRHLQEELSKGLPGLKPLCPTRWTYGHSVFCDELEKLFFSGDHQFQSPEDFLGNSTMKFLISWSVKSHSVSINQPFQFFKKWKEWS